MKSKVYNIILVILIIVLLTLIILIGIKYGKNQVKESELTGVVEEVKTQLRQIEQDADDASKKVKVEYKGYRVVGMINIPKIGIEYPIIDKTNDQAMKISITKFWGNNVNDIGNFSMAGHSYLDGTMFGKIRKLEIGDFIEMTDLTGRTIKYNVFAKYVIDANDVDCVNSVEANTREITLITCTNGRSNRLIVKAREII